MNRIFLIGYMGSGKTTIGKLLAARLHYSFVDIDVHIEKNISKSVSQIFAELGETKFRLIEQKCLCEVAEIDNVIISTGGGTPCFFDNMQFMNTSGLTFYLKFSPAQLASRLESAHANKRPLLAERKGEDLLQFIASSLALREPFYSQAAHTLSGDIESIVTKICELLEIKK